MCYFPAAFGIIASVAGEAGELCADNGKDGNYGDAGSGDSTDDTNTRGARACCYPTAGTTVFLAQLGVPRMPQHWLQPDN
jgi:hypothetical protein